MGETDDQMSEDRFIALIEELSAQCYGADVQGMLQEERANAIARYNTEPWGDEVDGRSRLVSSVIRDTVEEAMPQLLRIFIGGDEVVQFDPTGPEDEHAAKQETKYINHVITQKNPSFQIFSTWFRDALLCKNGYAYATWETKQDVKLETYKGLPDDALALITQDQSVQVVAQSSYPDPSGMFPVLHDVQIRRVIDKGYVRIDNIPPEELRVHVTTRDVNFGDCIYLEHRRILTMSEVREMGYNIPDDDAGVDTDTADIEVIARDRFDRSMFGYDWESTDPATRRVLFRHVYIRADRDGDGIAELRRVCLVNSKIVHEEEADLLPIACITPFIQPHRHIGYGYYDFLKEIESATTAMLRAYFDNVYLANNGRYGVNVNNVNIDDMLVSKPGGLVRVNGEPGNNIFPLNHSTDGSTALNALQYLDQWKKNATGVMADAQAISADVLNKSTASGIAQAISVWQGRIEAVARAFAETGVKELFRITHALILKNATAPDRAKIGGEWVAVDPREWTKRENLTISVGLGTGSKESKVAFLQSVAMQQAQAIPMGIATPKNVYETAMELMKEMGYKDGSRFWTDPDSHPPQPPQPAPEVLAAQEASKGLVQKAQIDAQSKIEAEQVKLQLEPQKMAQEADIRIKEAEIKGNIELEKARIDAQIELEKERIRAGAQVEARRHDAAMVKGAAGVDDDAMAAEKESAAADKTAMLESIQGLQAMIAQMVQNMGRPKRIVRGPDGRAAGIE